jgi:hypothetical protein
MDRGSSSTTFHDTFLGHEIVQRSDSDIQGRRNVIYQSKVSNVATELLANLRIQTCNLCGHCEKVVNTHLTKETISLLLMFNSTSNLSLSYCNTPHLKPENLML